MVITINHNEITASPLEPNIDLTVFSKGYFIYKNNYYSSNSLVQLITKKFNDNSLFNDIAELSGCFQIVILKRSQNCCYVIQDRWGTYPLFKYELNHQLFLSSTFSHLKDHMNDLSFDLQACAEMISFGHVMGKKTLIKGVEELSPHHWYKFSSIQGSIATEEFNYWNLKYSFKPGNLKIQSKTFADLWFHTMSILGDPIIDSGKACYIPLSAGLDSRLLAVTIDKMQIPQINQTFGSGVYSREIEVAGIISRSLSHSLGHYILYLTQENFLHITQSSPITHRITTGHFAEKDLWYPNLIKRECSFYISGHSGDFMAGSHFKTKMKRWNSSDEVVEYIVKFKGTPLGRHLYFTNSTFKELIHDSLGCIIRRDEDLINSFMRWDLEERQRRFIMRSVIAENPDDLPLILMPFFDYQLFDFFVDLPFEYLLNTKLYRHSMVHHIYKEKEVFSKIKANGQPIIPLLNGVGLEYWQKLNDYLNWGTKRKFAFSPNINWQTLSQDFQYPEVLPKEWLLKEYLPSNSRMFYSLSQFTKEVYSQSKQ